MKKYRGWTVWPCLCGFDGTIHQIRHHQRSCVTWKARDAEAVKQARHRHSAGPPKELPTGPRCPECGASPTHHKEGCPGLARLAKFGPPELWQAVMELFKRHYEETGRGKLLMSRFPD